MRWLTNSENSPHNSYRCGNNWLKAKMDIFYGRVTDSMAHVYARVGRSGPDDARTVSGWIHGPLCTLSHTLPATIALRDMGDGPTLLGAAAVPDPCFWSPQLPALYDVHVELREESQVVTTYDQTIGIRRLGAAGRNLLWEGKRWVLRGVGSQRRISLAEPVDQYVATFRDASAAMVLVDPVESICCRASQAGVVVIAQLTDPANIEKQLTELGRLGSVAVAILPTDIAASDPALHNAAPNLLLAQYFHAETAVTAADWADLIVCQVSEPARFHDAVAACPLPIVVQRRLNETGSVAEARNECDRIQRDLAPAGDYAGYLITQL
jgi:hypothetical protein